MKLEFGMKNEECGMKKGTALEADEKLGALAEMAAESEQSRLAAGGSVTEMGTGWLAPQYLLSLRGQLASLPEGPERFALLRKATGNVVSLQLAGVWAGRLRVEQEKLEFLRQKHQDRLKAVMSDEGQVTSKKRSVLEPMTDEELKACVDKVDEIFGLKPIRAAGAP